MAGDFFYDGFQMTSEHKRSTKPVTAGTTCAMGCGGPGSFTASVPVP